MKTNPIVNVAHRLGLIDDGDPEPRAMDFTLADEIVGYCDDLVSENSLLQRKFRAAVLAMRQYGSHSMRCISRELSDAPCDCGWVAVSGAWPEVKAL